MGRGLPAVLLLVLWYGSPGARAEDLDGQWRLVISGHHSFLFGDHILAAGLRIPWETIIEFRIRDGAYVVGNGETHWGPEVVDYSRPANWFRCRLSTGTFLDRGLHLRETPWVRLPRFPVAGEVHGQQVTLVPGFDSAGNYLAVTYHCENREPAANNWFTYAERGRKEGGWRQDAITAEADGVRSVEVKEVRSLPPEGPLTLPLQSGPVITLGDDQAPSSASYRLERLP